VNRYPDPHQRALKALIAELKGVDAGRIFIGNGSDEAIDLAFRIFCRPGLDNAVSIAPTYGMYRVAAATNDVQMREVPLGAGYSLPVGALLAAADERTKLIWLCSPNNPRRQSSVRNESKRTLAAAVRRRLVVVSRNEHPRAYVRTYVRTSTLRTVPYVRTTVRTPYRTSSVVVVRRVVVGRRRTVVRYVRNVT